MSTFTIKKIQDLFGKEIPRTTIIKAENTGNIPSSERQQTGSNSRRLWNLEDLPQIGEKYGFLKKLTSPTVLTVFTTKGGVLKSTLTLNIGRMAALHNIKTIIIGLDLQGDVTNALGFDNGLNEVDSLEEAQAILDRTFGLYDFSRGEKSLNDIILKTDIPTLDFIPETHELHQLEQSIGIKNNREVWLQRNVVEQLKKNYDLIIFDCSPNWNNLVTNAITACDVLLSPLECKINNFRNYGSFKMFVDAFKKETGLNFIHAFVPTRLSLTRKLSSEIRQWYLANTPNCINTAIREGIKGEEAMAKYISLAEHAPTSLEAQEMRQLIEELWVYFNKAQHSKLNSKNNLTVRGNDNFMSI